MTLKRVVSYVRVSTTGQAEDGFSIEAQLEAIRNIVKALGYTLVGEYIDRGISGKSIENREEFLRMMQDAKAGLFEEVIVYKMNRLSRNHLDLLKLYEEFERIGVTFKSVTEPFDTSNPSGKLLFNLLGSIGEFERETIVENVKNGMKQKAREGGFNGGLMLGYRSVYPDSSQNKKEIVVIEEEAAIVRMIFDWYINGKGFKYIAYRLNELGFKTVKSNAFSIYSVRTIINNPVYAGKIRFNNYVNHNKNKRKGSEYELVLADGNHTPIIDINTWEKAQTIFNNKKRFRTTPKKGAFLLTGLLKCPVCGSSMVAGRATRKDHSGNKTYYKYYQCSKYKNFGKTECNANSVNAEYAEEYVLNKLNEFTIDDGLVTKIINDLNDYVKRTVKPIQTKLELINKNVSQYTDKKERIFKLYEDGIIDQPHLMKRLQAFETEYESIKIQREELLEQINYKQTTKEIPTDHVKAILKNFGNVLKISSREQKKLLLNLVVEKITVHDNRKINNIELRFDETIQKTLLKEDSSDEESSIFMPFSLTV
jgi:site-specific DNA recombinase